MLKLGSWKKPHQIELGLSVGGTRSPQFTLRLRVTASNIVRMQAPTRPDDMSASGELLCQASAATLSSCLQLCMNITLNDMHDVAEDEELLGKHRQALPQVTVEFERNQMVSKVRADLTSANRLPVVSLESRFMVSSLDIISVNCKREKLPQPLLSYTAGDGLSLRTFASGDVIKVTGQGQRTGVTAGCCAC